MRRLDCDYVPVFSTGLMKCNRLAHENNLAYIIGFTENKARVKQSRARGDNVLLKVTVWRDPDYVPNPLCQIIFGLFNFKASR